MQKARRPALLAGRVEVVGYENPLYDFFREILLRQGGFEPTACFGWRSTRWPPPKVA